MINKEQVIKELGLRKFGHKGWMKSPDLKCPKCGRSDKFGIKFNEKGGGTAHCFYEVGEGMSLYRFLKHIGRDDLIIYEKGLRSIDMSLESLKNDEEFIYQEPDTKKEPKGYKRIFFDDYLDERGFEPEQYNILNVGKSDDYLLKNYIVFLLKQKGKVVGWLARSKYDKEWHNENLRKFKDGEGSLVLRYRNSSKTDFDRILGGFDEITPNTEEVWIVEGIFDKANLDRLYGLYNNEKVKCLFTFGNRVTDNHLYLLKTTNIKKIVMLYDYGTVKQVKKHSLQLARNFEVWVGEFKTEDIDAGDATKKYMDNIFSNLKNYFYFYTNRL